VDFVGYVSNEKKKKNKEQLVRNQNKACSKAMNQSLYA